MLTHATIVLALAALATAKKPEPLVSDNTTLLAARYSNNTRKFEKDAMQAFVNQVQMQQAMNPDSLKNLTKAWFGMPGLTLTIADEVGTPVGNVSQMQYGSIMLTIYQMPISVNSSKCGVYASAKVQKSGNKTLDSKLKSIIKAAEKDCHHHISAEDQYAVEEMVPGCWSSQNSSQRLDCLQPSIDKRTSFMNSLIARVATEELSGGLPTDRVNAETYQKDLKNQANLEIAGDFFFGPTPLLFLSVPGLHEANKLGRELQANATMQHGNMTSQ